LILEREGLGLVLRRKEV